MALLTTARLSSCLSLQTFTIKRHGRCEGLLLQGPLVVKISRQTQNGMAWVWLGRGLKVAVPSSPQPLPSDSNRSTHHHVLLLFIQSISCPVTPFLSLSVFCITRRTRLTRRRCTASQTFPPLRHSFNLHPEPKTKLPNRPSVKSVSHSRSPFSSLLELEELILVSLG